MGNLKPPPPPHPHLMYVLSCVVHNSFVLFLFTLYVCLPDVNNKKHSRSNNGE